MKKLHRITIVGLTVSGMALVGSGAALADTIHAQSSQAAGPNGAVSAALVSGAKDGKNGDGGVFYGASFQAAGPNGAVSQKVFSAAD